MADADLRKLTVTADGKLMKIQRSRQRRIHSCVYCHSKKIKCSREHPSCNTCNKLGLECKYFSNQRVSRGGKQSSRIVEKDVKLEKWGDIGDLPSPGHDNKSPNASYSSNPSEPNMISPKSRHSSIPSECSPKSKMKVEDSYSFGASSFTIADEAKTMAKKSSSSNISAFFARNINNLFDGKNAKAEKGAMDKVMSNDYPINIPFIGEPRQTLSSGEHLQEVSIQVDSNPEPSEETNEENGFHSKTERPMEIMERVIPETNGMSHGIPLQLREGIPRSGMIRTNGMDANMNPVLLDGEMAGGMPQINDLNDHQMNPIINIESQNPVNMNYMGLNQIIHNHGNIQINGINGVEVINMESSNHAMPGTMTPMGFSDNLSAFVGNMEEKPRSNSVHFLYGTNENYNNQSLQKELLKHLPTSKEKSFELIHRYVNSVHILFPILVNLDDFLLEHERYWGNNNSVKENYLEFYTLYFPVLYAAAISEFEEYDNLLLNQDIDRYLKGFNKICQYYNYPHGLKTIPLLLGNVLIQSTSPNPSTMEMSLIIRYAKFLQLHKDPLLTLEITDWEVVKFRRLLWWVIFGLDALTCHNFCLPPVCKYEDFNVVMPEVEDPVFEDGKVVGKKLNVALAAMNMKFKYDHILSELVFHLYNGLSSNITTAQITKIKDMINDLFQFIQHSIEQINVEIKRHPPETMQELNVVNFVKNHSWSYVDRALMLLHRKILMSENDNTKVRAVDYTPTKKSLLSFRHFEDTFGGAQEANIIKNFDKCSISQLKFNQHEDFSYTNLRNNLIPSILHNLNDFLKYNDFIKFGKYNWYVKRTIPIDSIILMFIIITIKFKYQIMLMDELCLYVKLINKALFILNRKWFKNEKYKRMLTLTINTWEYILRRYNVISLINEHKGSSQDGRIEFYDYQLTGYMRMNDLFSVMDVPEPIMGKAVIRNKYYDDSHSGTAEIVPGSNQLAISRELSLDSRKELIHMNEKIYYDLQNNFVDINDYCAFYTSLERILHELMNYINR